MRHVTLWICHTLQRKCNICIFSKSESFQTVSYSCVKKVFSFLGSDLYLHFSFIQAAAALAVGVGSFSDPKDAQGLAHFLGQLNL